MPQAIVTLAIGADYAERFERCCRANWTAYARRHGFDLIVITDALDTSPRARSRSPAWQKCLILGVPQVASCDRVVWVDSDICINPAAPSILDGIPPDRIGVTDEHRFPSAEGRQAILDAIIAAAPDAGDFDKGYWRAWRDPGAWHAFMSLPPGQSHIVQSGVMVLSPRHHRELLEHVYRSYDDPAGPQGKDRAPGWGEMGPLSHEIQARNLQHWIDPRFNALLWWLFLNQAVAEDGLPRFVHECYRRSYFLHFAGCAHLMPLISGET
jgi:hypothetical protein